METHDYTLLKQRHNSTFNFLASLINGNFSANAASMALSCVRAFNFLASLINGNLICFPRVPLFISLLTS